MNRLIMIAVLKLCGEAVLLTLFAGIVIGILGHLNQWDTSLKYSNAFFIAGCLAIIAGASSRFAAGQGWVSFQRIHAESLRDMDSGEQANFIGNSSSSVRLVMLGLLSGFLLILIAVLVTKLF